MARIRTIKPEFWHDEKLAEVSRDARLLFIGLWNYADDNGRLGGSPRVIRGLLFPFDDDIDVINCLEQLEGINVIYKYQVEGKSFFQVTNFPKHQKIDKRAKSWIPGPLNVPHEEEVDPAETKWVPANKPAESPDKPAESAQVPASDLNLGSQPQPKGTKAGSALSPSGLQKIWNDDRPPELPAWDEMPEDREAAARARLKKKPEREYWESVVGRIRRSRFCLGENDRGWRANPEFLLKRSTGAKVLEGQYDNRDPPKPKQSEGPPIRKLKPGEDPYARAAS